MFRVSLDLDAFVFPCDKRGSHNTMFVEGLCRCTQVVHDSKAKGIPGTFTWASRGNVAQYV